MSFSFLKFFSESPSAIGSSDSQEFKDAVVQAMGGSGPATPMMVPGLPGETERCYSYASGTNLSPISLPTGMVTITYPHVMPIAISDRPILLVVNATQAEIALLSVTVQSVLRFQNIDRNVVRVTRRSVSHIVNLQPVMRSDPQAPWTPVGDVIAAGNINLSAIRTLPNVTADGQGMLYVVGEQEIPVSASLLNSSHGAWLTASYQSNIAKPADSLTALAVVSGSTSFEIASSSPANPSVSASHSVIYKSSQLARTFATGGAPQALTVGASVLAYDDAASLNW